MKNKFENIFYAVTIIFAVFVILGNILFLILSNIETKNDKKPVYELSAPPVLDSFGNLYYFKKTYDHIPTKEDSLEFEKEKKNLFK